MNRSRSRSAIRVRRPDPCTSIDGRQRAQSEDPSDNSVNVVSPERVSISASPNCNLEFEEFEVIMAQPQQQQQQQLFAPRYVNFTSRATLHSCMQWYEVSQLMATLKNIWKINFSLTEQRQQAMLQLNNLEDAAPFSAVERFPEGRLYICTGTGDWLRKFQQLRTALSLKEHKQDKKATGEAQDISDSMVAFHNSITNLMTQIAQQENVYCRETFERLYGLIWQ